jgi:hypothetical protein
LEVLKVAPMNGLVNELVDLASLSPAGKELGPGSTAGHEPFRPHGDVLAYCHGVEQFDPLKGPPEPELRPP